MFGRKARQIRDLEERLNELTDPKILEAHIKDGRIDMRLKSPFARLIFWFFWKMLQGESGSAYAPNCVELAVGNYADPAAGMIIITAQRQHGKTMAQLKDEAEKMLATAVDLLELCAGNFPNVRKDGNTDEFMDYLKELYEKAAAFVDAYRQKHPRARSEQEMG